MNIQSSIIMACLFVAGVIVITQLLEMCDYLAEELALAEAENDFLYLKLRMETSHG